MPVDPIARETIAVLDQGWYEAEMGRVSIAEDQRNAVAGTVLFRPRDLVEMAHRKPVASGRCQHRITVTQESTQAAAHRLVVDEGVDDLAVLNFASARKVGGGFLRGARAQEEDLARSSGLYRCLETQPEYYDANQAAASFLYTDHMIHAPAVPWFRSEDGRFLTTPFLASIITAPAPNAREYLKSRSSSQKILKETLARRAGFILDVAASRGNRSLLLGAWGCGVFQNDPRDVAGVFASCLDGCRFRGVFDRVVFAILDQTRSKEVYAAFRSRF